MIIIIMAGLSLVPAIFSLSIVHYVVGVVSVIAILIALTFFVMKIGTPIPDDIKDNEQEDDTEKTKWQMSKQKIKGCWFRLQNACNSVGFILFLCVLLIIGIGVFDSLMSKNNEVNNRCDYKQEIEIQKTIPHQIDSLSQERSEFVQ